MIKVEPDPLEKRKAIIGSLGRTPTEDKLTIYIKQETEPPPKEPTPNNVQNAVDTQQEGGLSSRLISRYRQQRVLDVPNEFLRTIEESDPSKTQKESESYDNSPGPLPKKTEEISSEREKKRYQRTMVTHFLCNDESRLIFVFCRLQTLCDRSSKKN